MRRVGGKRLRPEQQLGRIAMEFRSTRDEKKRAEITAEYAKVVSLLIKGGKWREAPAPEDLLPDDRLPLAFFKYWLLPVPNGANGEGRTRDS